MDVGTNFGTDGTQPVPIDTSVRFSSIGGLKEHIKCLREMIIFPLMYPELFKRFNTRPAKGILFHGPPGTGKTLLARALANECSLVAGRRVSFFMRKGADVINKYYGESERNLRMLFQTARKKRPSIIFFDEIDALAPVRRASQDNHNASLVATLLAEMDGVSDRGEVIVIGATNRPDAMDPAVRRAGRFDRELYFPPPKLEDRLEILKIYTNDWDPGLSDETLGHIAKVTAGYLGSDIKALCSEAVLKAVRRVYPQIYESDCKLLINAANVEVTPEDMLNAIDEMSPTGARYAPHVSRPLPPYTVPLLADQLKEAAELMLRTFPARGSRGNKGQADLGSAPSVFLITGECSESLLAPALLAQLEHCLIKELSVSTLHAAHVNSPARAVTELFAECRRSGRECVIFIRDLQAVWNVLAGKNGAEVLLQLWRSGSVGERTLSLAATNSKYQQLSKALQEVFPTYKDCIYCVRKPKEIEVSNFLQPVIMELPLVPPIVYQHVPPPPLPKAPIVPLEDEKEAIRRLFREYDNLRQLRTSLKDICHNLSSIRSISQSLNPDPELFLELPPTLSIANSAKMAEIKWPNFDAADKQSTAYLYNMQLPDYFSIVKKPMDLATIISKIDNKQYYCAKEFLDDIDLICGNALLYERAKPNNTDKNFRQRAFTLHDTAYGMVADEIPTALELECQLVARRRRETGHDYDDEEPIGWSDDFYLSKLGSSDINDIPDLRTSRKNRKRRSVRIDEPAKYAKKARIIQNISRNNMERALILKDDNIVNDKIEDGTRNIMYNPFVDDVVIMKCNDKRERDVPVNLANNDNEDPPATEPKEDLIINTAELNSIMRNNLKSLCWIGLEALIDLHAELRRTVYGYSQVNDRKKLPRDLNDVVTRYVRHAKK